MDSATGPGFQKLTGLISLALAIPVVAFSAMEYWRSAWISLRQRMLNIDVPIAAGILALFAQSVLKSPPVEAKAISTRWPAGVLPALRQALSTNDI